MLNSVCLMCFRHLFRTKQKKVKHRARTDAQSNFTFINIMSFYYVKYFFCF